MDNFVKTVIQIATNSMSGLIGPIFSATLKLLMPMVSGLMAICSGVMKETFSMDSAKFLRLFPISYQVQDYIQSFAISLVVGLFVMALFRNIFSGLGFSAEDPFKLTFRFFISLFITINISNILSWIFKEIFNDPYNNFMGLVSDKIYWAAFDGTNFQNSMKGNSIVAGVLKTFATSTTDMLVDLLACIVLIMIAVNYFKLLVEMAERYLLANVLIIFAPLAGSASTLESTMNVFKSFCRMFFGQMILLLANAISLAMVNSAMGTLTADIQASVSDNVFADIIILLAFLRLAQHMDNYLKDVGINAGITGGSMIDEIVATCKTISSAAKAVTTGGMLLSGSKAAQGLIKGANNIANVGPGSTAGAQQFASGDAAGRAASAVTSRFSHAASSSPFNKVSNGGASSVNTQNNSASGFNASKAPAGGTSTAGMNGMGPMSMKTEPFNTGKTAQTQAMSSLGAASFNRFGAATGGMNLNSIKSTANGAMMADNQGNMHAFFNKDPGGNGITPFTGADGQTYYHQNVSDMDPQMAGTMNEFYNNGTGTMDPEVIQQSFAGSGADTNEIPASGGPVNNDSGSSFSGNSTGEKAATPVPSSPMPSTPAPTSAPVSAANPIQTPGPSPVNVSTPAPTSAPASGQNASSATNSKPYSGKQNGFSQNPTSKNK